MSTARELQRMGFDATIYEGRSEAGGAPRYFISPLRRNPDILQAEVQQVQDLGVKFELNSKLADLDHLKEKYDHVVVCSGLQQGKTLPNIVGYSAIDFFASSNTDGKLAKQLAEDKRVVVIGGGSVAMDAAITCRALGALDITVTFPESHDNVPADLDKVKLAQNAIATLLPERVVVSYDEAASVLQIRHVTRHKEVSTLYADTVIHAIGQDRCPVTVTLLNHDNVEYAGDAVNGGATVVQAIAEGKQVAERIARQSIGHSLSELDRLRWEGEEALQIDFCGIKFPNPFCLSSSPVSNTAEMCARAFDAGWGGVVYKTLNLDKEQEILHPSPRLSAVHVGSSRMGIGLQNVEQISDRRLTDNLADISWLKENYPSNILGVSVMGFSESGWKELARAAEVNGADWIELKFSCPQMRNEAGGHRVGQDADLIERFTAAAKSACSIPVVAKMTPNLTDMLPQALAAQRGRADGVSAVNTFKSISHVHLDYSDTRGFIYKPQPNIQGASSISGFSGPACRPMALRFIADLAKDPRLTIPISGMGGIRTWKDATEFLSLGASNLQCTTAVMRHGINLVEDLKDGLLRHLRRLGHESLSEVVGASLPAASGQYRPQYRGRVVDYS